MRLKRATIVCSFALSLLFPRDAYSDPIDPPAARELLKQGYALKKAGKYAEALALLVESLRLDSQLKTLINIADCEEQLGQLTIAQQHWISARDQAALKDAQVFLQESQKRLAALESRMPRLTVNRTGTAIHGTEIRRDGVLLGNASLGVALPTDPGTHVVVATAPGYLEGRYAIDLAEGESKALDVALGSKLDTVKMTAPPVEGEPTLVGLPPSSPVPKPSDAAVPYIVDPVQTRFWSAQRVIAIGTGGLGLIAFVTSGYAWARANAQHAEAASRCKPDCTDAARQLQEDAVGNVHVSNGMLVAGSALLGAGALLWFTAPSPDSVNVALVPALQPAGGGVVARGRF